MGIEEDKKLREQGILERNFNMAPSIIAAHSPTIQGVKAGLGVVDKVFNRADVDPGTMDPKFEPRVGASERAEELGLRDPTDILIEAEQLMQEQGITVDQNVIKEKKKEFYRAIAKQEPEIWEFMKNNNGNMTQEQWESLPIELGQQARIIARLTAPKQEQGFDYTSGVGTTTNDDGVKFKRHKLSSLDTNTEKEDYLNATVGYDGWTTDRFGRYALNAQGLEVMGLDPLKPNEKGRIIDEFQGFTYYDWVDATPHIIQTMPGLAASIWLAPYGTVIGILGTGLIGTTGYLGDELLEYSQGWSNQSPEAIAKMAAEHGMWYGVGEGAFRVLRPIGRMISDPHSGFMNIRPNAPYTRAGVLKAYPGLENNIRAMYGTMDNGTPLPEVEIQKLINKAIKHLRFKTPLTGDTTIPGAADPFNPNTRIGATVENERRQIIKDILEGNGTYSGVPSISISTDRAIIGRLQSVFDMVFKQPRDAGNRRYLNHTMLLLQGKAAGLSDDQLKNYVAKFGTEEELSALNSLSEMIMKRVTDSSQSYDDAMKMILQNIEKETDEAISFIRSQTGLLGDESAVALANRLKTVQVAVDSGIESFANSLDNSLHELNLFNTEGIKKQIQFIKSSLPKIDPKQVTKEVPTGRPYGPSQTVTETIEGFNTDLPYVAEIVKLIRGIENMPNVVDAKQMIYLEKAFKGFKSEGAQQSGFGISKEVDNILSAIDESFINAKGVLKNHVGKLSVGEKNTFKESFHLLDDMNKMRIDTKGMFDDVFVAKMIQDAKSGAQGFIETADVINYFVKQGRGKAFLRMLHALPASERAVFKASIARQTFDDVLTGSKNNITGGFEGIGFLNQWSKLDDGIKKTLFGANSKKIDTLAKEIAMKNGKFSQEEISVLLNAEESSLTKLLNQKVKTMNEADEKFGKVWMKKLLGDDIEREQVIDFIFRPKSSTRINEAKEFLGKDAFNQFREAAMLKILQGVGSDAMQPGLGPIFNGPAFRKTLDLYGKETLHATFGKELTKDLYKFANEVTILTSKGQSGGLVAANVALLPLKKPVGALKILAPFKVISYLMNKPGFLEYLTFGMKSPYTRKGAAALARVNAMASAQGVQDKIIGSEGRQNEIMPVDRPSVMETIKEAPGKAIEAVKPPLEEISGLNVNPASDRFANATMAPPLTNRGTINQDTRTLGKELFGNDPREITFANQGGIMSTNKAFQRVA